MWRRHLRNEAREQASAVSARVPRNPAALAENFGFAHLARKDRRRSGHRLLKPQPGPAAVFF